MLAVVVVSLLGQSTPTPEERIQRARAELRAGDEHAALIELCEGVDDHPEAWGLRAFRGGFCEALADDCEARMAVDRANADALDPEGKIRDWSGRWLFDAPTGTRDEPSLEDLTYYARRLRAMLYWGNPLVETHQRALERVPTNELEHWYRLTNALLVDAGEVARQEAEALLQKSPDDPLLHLVRGLALLALGRLDEAQAELECTLELGLLDPFVLDRLALLHARTGNFERALAALDEALRLDAENDYGHWHRIAVRACRGEWSAALAEAEELAARHEEWEYEYAILCELLREARADGASADPALARRLDLGLAPYEDESDLRRPDVRDESKPVVLSEVLVDLPAGAEEALYGSLARLLRERTDALEEPEATSGPLLDARRAFERFDGPRALVHLDAWLATHPEDARAWRWRARALEAWMLSLRAVSSRDELDSEREDPSRSAWYVLGEGLVRRHVLRSLESEGFVPWLEQSKEDVEALAFEIERLALASGDNWNRRDDWIARLRRIVPVDAQELAWQRAGLLWEGSNTRARTYAEELRARDKAVAALPNDGLAWAARGQLRLHLGRVADAAADLARARELAPDDARVLVLCGDLQEAQGDVEGALATWRRALELDRSRGDAYRRRIVFLRQRGELEQALAELEALKEIQADEDNRALVASLLGELGKKMEPHEAVEALTAAIQAGGFDPQLYLRRAQRYLELGETAKARADFSAVWNLAKYRDASDGIDQCTALEQGITRAEARRRRILASPIANLADLRERVELRRESGDAAGQLADFQQALEVLPESAGLRLEYGKLLKELGRVEEAWAAFDRALALDPALREARLERLWILCYRGRDQAAIQEATLLIEAHFGTVEVYWARAESAMALGNHELAIHDYLVLRSGGEDVRADLAEAYFLLGVANQRMGYYQSAATAYFHSCAEKESAQTYYNMAVCYGKDGYASEAFENENKARALGHTGPPVLVYEEGPAPCWACGGAGGSQGFDRDVYSGTSTTETTYDSYGNSTTRILGTSGGWETRQGEWIPCSTCRGRGGR